MALTNTRVKKQIASVERSIEHIEAMPVGERPFWQPMLDELRQDREALVELLLRRRRAEAEKVIHLAAWRNGRGA